MATGPARGLLGIVCLLALVALAGIVFVLGNDPQTADLVAAGPSKRDPALAIPGTIIGLIVGVVAVALFAVLGRGSR